MIINQKPLTLSEVKELLGKSEKEEKMASFIKQFDKTGKNAEKVKQELRELNLLKLKEETIVKLADFLPADAIELTKVAGPIFDQDETNKILEVIKKY